MPTQLELALEVATTQCQRWKNRKVRYRPPGEVFNPSCAEVVRLPERDARAFTLENHYSGSFPAARFCVGLMVKPRLGREYLGGVAVYSVPMTQSVIPAVIPGLSPSEGIELGRLVLLDTPEVGVSNAESWFIARAHRMMRHHLPEIRGVVAYCDPIERRDACGQLVKRTHTGVIYRASGCTFRGMSSPRTLLLTPDGQIASERALSKLRTGDQGRDYAEAQLRHRGAPPRRRHEAAVDWLQRLRADGFLRPLRHPGNLRFCWHWRKPHGTAEL
ncbi:Mom family adenine methylcarbamoylation protein [Burkholderia contaminans]|uniref:Mom family adenine methylcarbamoylation protein n=1 Tax=Burkholderia contaminans TaxID=488447 RepID=UPI004045FEC3